MAWGFWKKIKDGIKKVGNKVVDFAKKALPVVADVAKQVIPAVANVLPFGKARKGLQLAEPVISSSADLLQKLNL